MWANAKLVRYAGDFVILARYIDGRIERWAEQKLEEWMKLTTQPRQRCIVIY